MGKVFNVTGACNPKYHYMVNIEQRLQDIKQLVDAGNYFAINRARQYGKTTTLSALADYLREEYIVVYLDFQMLGNEDFVSEASFVSAFARELMVEIAGEDRVSEQMRRKLEAFTIPDKYSGRLSSLFLQLSEWCAQSRQAIVLMINEVDSASNNQVFLDFLAQLRGYFLARTTKGRATFQSVILAGVYNIKNLKLKVNPDTEHKLNSPWNIATDFTLDMSFNQYGIAGMLQEYEADHHTGMDIDGMAQLLYDYTSGYPYLVSRLCKIMDEQLAVSAETGKKAWTKEVFLEAVRILLSENNSLFESLIHKLMDFPELKQMIHDLLFNGKDISNTVGLQAIENAVMFGFVKIEGGMVVIANRIFETLLYNLFLASPQLQQSELYKAACY